MQIINLYLTTILMDAPTPWSVFFQDSASPAMEGIIELHNTVMFYLVLIFIGVSWVLFSVIRNFIATKSPISQKYLNHGTVIEIIWTVTPAIILILIAFPSFKLLYLQNEVHDASLSIIARGQQWYWAYQYPDFITADGDPIEFDSYLIQESDLEMGDLRMLEVDNRLVLPENTNVRLILTSGDVIHSWAIPSLGQKLDCYPGRLNQTSVFINRPGIFYGQCSELCGILHSSMPIVVEAVSLEKFVHFLSNA
uniref:Cytochrome c oxidase subunit 2 n=1 Tax=Claviceps purpurea TaxID=5111 RepID=I7ICQ7_CLAPU|nr:Cytochrome c oxidase subunit 2 precursor [Claviceps purpurea]